MVLLSCTETPTVTVDDEVVSHAVMAKMDRVAVNEFGGWPFWFNTLNPLPFVNFRQGEPDWVPVILYHDMSCTPDNLDFLSPGLDFGSLACPSLVDGFMLWPEEAMIPKHQMLRAVGPLQIWFVSMEDWWEAADDGQVLMAEFENLPSFRSASANYHLERTEQNAATIVSRGVVTSEADMEFRLHLVAQFTYDDMGNMLSEDIPLFDITFR